MMNEFEVKQLNILQSLALTQEKLCVYQLRTAIALEKIANLFEQSKPRTVPNYRAILEQWHEYDWGIIGAEIELTDNYGVASVIWQGERYKGDRLIMHTIQPYSFLDALEKPQMVVTFTSA
jgi:hypothetical protein